MIGETADIYMVFYYEVQCGKCHHDEHNIVENTVWTKKQFIADLRRDGWSFTTEYGWLCPDCVAERKGSK